LLLNHPELKPTAGQDPAAKRFRVYRFFVQAGWYEEAEKELQGILKDFPDQKEQVESSRANLTKLRTLRRIDEVEQAHKAGRYQWVHQQFANAEHFPGTALAEEGLDDKLVARLRT